jgi:hypothetical protein
MDEVDVSRQLKQMTDFIRQEAVEKAVEIEAAAAEVKPAPPARRIVFYRNSRLGSRERPGGIRIARVRIWCSGR